MDCAETDEYLHQQFSCSSSGSVTTSFYDTSNGDEIGKAWFGINSSISTIAQKITKNIDVIARGAKNLMNELAELENEVAMRNNEYKIKTCNSCDPISTSDATFLPLPWEICLQSTDTDLKVSIVQREDKILKERVLNLCNDEETFTQPFHESSPNVEAFCLEEDRVILIRRLLKIDGRLGQIHAKVSGRSEVKETLFWQNFFFNCERLREERQKEINDENLVRASHDDDLDAELVGRPPSSCTGFYPKTGKLQACTSSEYEGIYIGHVVPSIQNENFIEDFVFVKEEDAF